MSLQEKLILGEMGALLYAFFGTSVAGTFRPTQEYTFHKLPFFFTLPGGGHHGRMTGSQRGASPL